MPLLRRALALLLLITALIPGVAVAADLGAPALLAAAPVSAGPEPARGPDQEEVRFTPARGDNRTTGPRRGDDDGGMQAVAQMVNDIRADYPVIDKVVLPLLILLFGWLGAKIISYFVYRGLTKTTVDDWLAKKLRLDLLIEGGDKRGKNHIERFFASILYYILMALVIIMALESAGLEQAAQPIQGLVDTVMQALPQIGMAILIMFIAWGAALILRKIVERGLEGSTIDNTFAEAEGKKGDHSFAKNAGSVVYGLVLVCGLATALDALELKPISDPLHNAIDKIIGVLPSVGVAALLLIGGFVISRVARKLVEGILVNVGLDRLVERIGLSGLFGKSTASKFVASVIGFFIVLQAALAAVNELGLETLSQPITDMMKQFWNLLPPLTVSIVVVVVGVIFGRMVRSFVATALRNLGFDRLLERLGFGTIAQRRDRLGEPSELAGFVAQLAVILLAAAQALDNLELQTWSSYVNVFLSWSVKHVLVALLILGVGFAVGNYVRDVIDARRDKGETSPAWAGMFARMGVLVFAWTMAIHQLGVAEDFVLLSFGLMFGGLCLAAALAFGLGAREVAGDIVRRRYDKARGDEGPGGPPGAPYDSGYFPGKPDNK
ncbi:MAG: mechanosensitive ion channel [Nannocystaceae bacterium]